MLRGINNYETLHKIKIGMGILSFISLVTAIVLLVVAIFTMPIGVGILLACTFLFSLFLTAALFSISAFCK